MSRYGMIRLDCLWSALKKMVLWMEGVTNQGATPAVNKIEAHNLDLLDVYIYVLCAVCDSRKKSNWRNTQYPLPGRCFASHLYTVASIFDTRYSMFGVRAITRCCVQSGDASC